jgi:hypothetical protein
MEKRTAKKSDTTKATKSTAKKTVQTKTTKRTPGTPAKPRRKTIQASAAPKKEETLATPTTSHACVFPNPKQPRKTFEPGHIEDLARSIYQVGGLVQPIKLTPRNGANATQNHMIVAGECRWRAYGLLLSIFSTRDEELAKTLDINPNVRWFPSDVPATMESVWTVGLERFSAMAATTSVMTDDEVQDAAIIENLQRRNVSPLEEARAFQERLDALAIAHPGESPEQLIERLALRLGIKQSWRITERTTLLGLSEELQDAFVKSLITSTQAFELSRLPVAHQRHIFEAIRDGHCKSAYEIRQVAQLLVDAAAKPLPMFSMDMTSGGISPAPIATTSSQPAPEAKADEVSAGRQVVSKLETKIDAVLAILEAGFDGNEIIIVNKVLPGHASMVADKLSLIRSHLGQLETALRTAASIEHVSQKLAAQSAAANQAEVVA